MSRGVSMSRAPSRYFGSTCANWARIAARALSESCAGRRAISRRTSAGSSGTGRAGGSAPATTFASGELRRPCQRLSVHCSSVRSIVAPPCSVRQTCWT